MQTELQWQQILSRDARHDGRFVSRSAPQACIAGHRVPADVRAATRSNSLLRRKRPNVPAIVRACVASLRKFRQQAQYIIQARQLIDNSESTLTLAALSKRVGISAFHLQRLFKRATGLSPREYQVARRTQQLKSRLRSGADVTTSLYDAGYGSPSRLYEVADQQLGMTPATYGKGGSGERIAFTVADSVAGQNVAGSYTTRDLRGEIRRQRQGSRTRPAK